MDPQTTNQPENTDTPRPNSNNMPGVVFSLLLVAAGVVLLLDHMGIIEVSYLFRFWPAAVILLGVSIALQPDPSSRIWGSAVGVGGIILLLRNLGYVHVEFWDIWWPLAMIGGGISLLWGVTHPVPGRSGMGDWRSHRRGRLHGAPFLRPDYWQSTAAMNETAIFGGGDRYHVGDFEGGRVSVVFGGYRIDLREAQMKGDSAYIHVAAIFGGVNLRIPPDWDLIMRGVPIFGGYADRTHHPQKGPGTKTLYVVGAVVFGGVEVKN